MTTRSGRASHLHQSAPLSLPGRGGVWSGAGGPRRLEGLQPIPPAEAARVCSIPLVVCACPLYRYRSWEHRPRPSHLGTQRVRKRQSPPTSERSSASCGLTKVPARCRVRSSPAPRLHVPTGPALHADLSASVAVSALSTGTAPGTDFPNTHLAVSSHVWPTGTKPGPSSTPARVGHRPSTLDSQEER